MMGVFCVFSFYLSKKVDVSESMIGHRTLDQSRAESLRTACACANKNISINNRLNALVISRQSPNYSTISINHFEVNWCCCFCSWFFFFCPFRSVRRYSIVYIIFLVNPFVLFRWQFVFHWGNQWTERWCLPKMVIMIDSSVRALDITKWLERARWRESEKEGKKQTV